MAMIGTSQMSVQEYHNPACENEVNFIPTSHKRAGALKHLAAGAELEPGNACTRLCVHPAKVEPFYAARFQLQNGFPQDEIVGCVFAPVL
eukprot:m.486521 g.486521  ORF g.486521 m.486521 type:complete len:90 (-) comp78232_c0_seq1:23-292(-)